MVQEQKHKLTKKISDSEMMVNLEVNSADSFYLASEQKMKEAISRATICQNLLLVTSSFCEFILT